MVKKNKLAKRVIKKITLTELLREIISFKKYGRKLWSRSAAMKGEFSNFSYSDDSFLKPGREENPFIIEADIEQELISINKTITKNIEFYLSSTDEDIS
ncbi:hypothetical protein [Candidatus Mycoplasma haematohominis]|uniref:Uncharacterized protein n=1 Tax=Candidatus Mycoplasma haematohominis TaxID=1494318 RepID=A0A478FQH0_9MOLU|nr:hypothetical protein [Candidatus Mycoplasma haemohominis]GCE63164.1 hypothetical protein MHSWG343_01420 [Candidatus Mycoplasma haemohominis]